MARGTFSRYLRAKETGLIAVILALGVLLAAFGGKVKVRDRDPGTGRVIGEREVNTFLQPANIDSILKNSSWTAVMAVGVTVVIIAGGIDLSIGAIYCLAAVGGAMLLRWLGPGPDLSGASPGWAVPAGIALTLAVGTLCGVVNGLMVVVLKVHPFIITLGTMSIFRGIAFVVSGKQSVTDFPPALGGVFRHTVMDFTIVPIATVVLVVLAGHLYLKHTVAGRHIYAVGGNEEASLFSGLRISRIKLSVFALTGLAGGVAAVIYLGTFGAADSSTGRGYELDVIAAAVVGGASLSGGHGTALGALLGAVVIQLIGNGIVIMGIESDYTVIIQGAVIIVAVVLDRLSATLSERRLLRQS